MQLIALDLSFETRKGDRRALSRPVPRQEAYFASARDNAREGGRLDIDPLVRGVENG